MQADLFAEAIQTGGPAPTPLEEAVRNMEVIDAVFRTPSAGTGSRRNRRRIRRWPTTKPRRAHPRRAAGREAIAEQKMFGGLGFLYHGNMCTGVRGTR